VSRDPSLEKMLLASMLLHVAVMLAFSVTGLFRSHQYIAPNPYFVDLVPSEPRRSSPPARRNAPPKKEPAVEAPKPPKPAPKPVQETPPKSDMSALRPELKKKPETPVQTDDTSRLKEEIERLKRIKDLEQISRLREAVGASRESDEPGPDIPRGKGTGGASPEKMAVYYGIIRLQVMDSWVLQGDRFDQNLAAEIVINIGREGGVLKQKIERSSGNPDFDRSVMRAIAKASPFPPPPEGVDTEIQFKFTPKEDIR